MREEGATAERAGTPRVRSAILRGRQHTRLGAIGLVAEGPAAIAISMGGARKTYPHTDPNEDAALFASGPGGLLAAVADGHAGFDAAEVALERLLERFAPRWTGAAAVPPETWGARACAALADLDAAILDRTENTPKEGARTTLALALLRPGEERAFVASIGDSHAFCVGPERVDDLVAASPGCDPHFFLGGMPKPADDFERHAVAEAVALGGRQAIVLVTDGLSERGVGVKDPAEVVRTATVQAARGDPELRPVEAARRIAQAALDAHLRNPSGDNVSVAVLWVAG